MIYSKKLNYLLRKYDFVDQNSVFCLEIDSASQDLAMGGTSIRTPPGAARPQNLEGPGPNICIDPHRACWHVKCVRDDSKRF